MKIFLPFFTILFSLLILGSCNTEDSIKMSVITKEATYITESSARLNGDISINGDVDVYERVKEYGFVYGPNTDVPGRHVYKTFSPPLTLWYSESFFYDLTGLEENTEYYFLAYAINESNDTISGKIQSFTTSFMSVSTNDATDITETSATINGSISINGNVRVREYGFLFGPNADAPTRHVCKTFSPSIIESTTFNYDLTELEGNTKYYFQAYAIDEGNNTVSGKIQTFVTKAPKVLPSIEVNSFYAKYEEFWPREIFYIKGSATLFPEGETVIEAGFLCDPNFEPDYKNSSANRFMCEIINNTISFEETRQGGSGPDRFDVVYERTNLRAYMILSDGSIIYSDTHYPIVKYPL